VDKRFLSALLLCFVIVVGWGILFPPPEKPVAPTATPAPASTAAPEAVQATTPPAPVEGARVLRDEVERMETLVLGEGSQRWRVVATNRGGTIAELRHAALVQDATLADGERDKPENWAVVLSSVDDNARGSRSLALRASPSAELVAGKELDSALWTMRLVPDSSAPRGVEWQYAPGTGVVYTKRLVADPGAPRLRFELEIRNESSKEAAGRRDFVLVPATGLPYDSGDSFYMEPSAVAWAPVAGDEAGAFATRSYTPDTNERLGALSVGLPVGWVGVHNKYFAALLSGRGDADRAAIVGTSWRALYDAPFHAKDKATDGWRQMEAEVALGLDLPLLGESRSWTFDLYAGPKDRSELRLASPDYRHLSDEDLGFFAGIAKALLAIMDFFHGLTGSWGMAIILLTLFVRLVLFPLNRRSQTAMAKYQSKMKRVQPRIEELKKRFEKDPARLRQEQAKLMQEEGAFPPLGGCLPPLLQIPIFIGLFKAVGVSFDLRQEPFLGIVRDLSLPDQLLPLGVELPLVGSSFNVLPPLMVVMWILQQRSMPRPTEEQALMMYKMMMWMPVVMGVFLYNYAAGLSLYMITQSTLGIVEIKVIKKYWPLDDKEEPKKDGFFSKLMKAQQEKMEEMQKARGKGR
jgi:YidC/Oxa1 family membrane protein insertase